MEVGSIARALLTHSKRLVPERPAPVSDSWMQWPVFMPGGGQQIVGEQSYQPALVKLSGGRTWDGTGKSFVTACLVAEPRNSHTKAPAVRAEIGGMVVGYIPSDQVKQFYPAVLKLSSSTSPVTCRAYFTGGWDRGPDDRGSIGVVLDIDESLRRRTDDCPFLPGESMVSVSGEDQCQTALQAILGPKRGASCTALLVESDEIQSTPGSPSQFLIVSIDGVPIGYLSSKLRDRYLPMVRKVRSADFPPTCTAILRRKDAKVEVQLSLPKLPEILIGQ